jgi:hypothetical protein
MQGLAEFLKATTIDSAREAREVIQSFRESAEALTEVTRNASLQVSGVKGAVQDQLTELSQISTQVNAMAQGIREQLRAQAEDFAAAAISARNSTALARTDAGEAGEILTRQVAALEAAAAQMKQNLGAVSADIDTRIRQMTAAAEEAVARAGTVGQGFERQAEALNKAITAAAGQAEVLGEKFREQSLDLAKTSSIALERIDKLRETQHNSTRDAFLRVAAVMIEELNSLAVDINSLLDGEIPEDVWKKFREGDRSIFARRLFRNKDAYVIPAIEQRYHRDERFRDMVDRYIHKFEDLLTQSGIADPEAVLNATFITADVGKLYLVMAKSLGRATEH